MIQIHCEPNPSLKQPQQRVFPQRRRNFNAGWRRSRLLNQFPTQPFATLLLILAALSGPAQAADANKAFLCVRDFGAKGDGKTDDTGAFQKALDAAGKAGGGVVFAPRGNYLFAGSLNVPPAVTLRGVWESVPAHNGLRDAGLPRPTDDGTTFLVTGGAGREDAPAFITLNHNSTLKGVVIFYPNQPTDAEPTPYPFAIAMRGKNPAVLAVELLNPFNGIDATQNERHLIRDVHGQPIRRGVLVDAIYDIGRIENVHFNPWWSVKPKLFQWQRRHGEAFIVGRSDWQYIFNTFCFGYGVGYRFIKTKAGACNGNFLGIGADACHTAVLVEETQPPGLLITNGEFVAFDGEDPTMVRVTTNHTGVVRFVNCSFWGPAHQIARIAGRGTVGFGDCTFVEWDRKRKGFTALQVESGYVLVRGCEFREDKPQIALGPDVRRAVITENLLRGPLRLTNQSKGRVIIRDNADEPDTVEAQKH
ncbi:MAG: glycoside hydrolase family 55 protein [Verrucomicrobiae bacterium]|nr:glycoside hydrolase family 55 protein [Verrucomicrobiae bacterium]